MSKLDITEEQKQAYLNDCEAVDRKHGLQHFAMLHPDLQSIRAVLGIRLHPSVKKENESTG